MDYLRLNLADELPEIGCGHHYVLSVEVTDRYAVVFEPSSGVFATLDRDSISTSAKRYHGFDELARGSLKNAYDPERMVERICRNAKANGNWSAGLRDVCVRLGASASRLPPVSGEQLASGGVALTPAAAADPDAPTTALPGERIGAFAERLLMARHDPAAVMAFVKASFPTSKFDLGHAAWYLGKLRKKHGAENVPAWPRSAFKP